MAGAERPGEETCWLTPEEMATWLPYIRMVTLLPQALDRQLRADAGITHIQYQILAQLSAAPAQARRMSDLARDSAISVSRLSHAVDNLESRGWVGRCASDQDGRGQVARLTPAGVEFMERTAPGHVREVRRLVFDGLDACQVAALGEIAAHIAGNLPD